MPFDVKLLLPSNLSNDYLKGEFIDQGKAYISNKFDNDPNLDLNKNWSSIVMKKKPFLVNSTVMAYA
jgi:hypothetical protein